jgi:hypothetical protein
MSAEQCLNIIREAGGDLTDNEIDQLLTELQRRQRINEASGKFIDGEEAALKAAEQMGKDMKLAAAIAKREAADNEVKFLKAVSYLESQWSGAKGASKGEGLAALIYSSNKVRDGGRRSVMGYQEGQRSKLQRAFISDMLSIDKVSLEMLSSGQFDAPLYRAMYDIRQGKTPTGPEFVPEIAQVLVKHQEHWRALKNENGAWIGKLDDYIVSRSHNPTLIKNAGFEGWKAEIEQHLDWARTLEDMPDKNKDEFLENVYKGLAYGHHLKTGDSAASGFKGPSNLAKKLSQERVLHFKSPEAEYAYAQKFASGGLGYQIAMALEHTSQSVGLMKVLGANPGNMIERLIKHVNDTTPTGLTPEESHMINVALSSVDGTMKTPVNDVRARITTYALAAQSMSKLGGSLLSQFGDIAPRMMEFKRQGMNPLEAISSQVEGFVGGLGGKERQEAILDIIGLSDALTAEMTRAAAVDPIGGRVAAGLDMFFRITGQHRWQQGAEGAAAVMMAQNLARRSVDDFAKLPESLQVALRQHSIGEGEWQAIRQGIQKSVDGTGYLSPQSPKDLPNEAIDHLLTPQQLESAQVDRWRDKMREELADRMYNFYSDRVGFATIKPDAKTRAMLLQGTQPGSWLGVGMRLVTQFKSFPTAFLQKAMGASIYGSGSDTLGQAIKNPKAMGDVASLVLTSTVMGYMSMVAKDLVKGRQPRDPTDPRTMMAALQQGGGLGIYGDFLFGEAKSRTGGTLISNLAGPTLGTADEMTDIWRRIRNGDDAAAKAFNVALGNTPFMNVFYLRPVLDYMILNSLTEAMNPGALRRREALITKENEQGWLLRPSQNYADPLGLTK